MHLLSWYDLMPSGPEDTWFVAYGDSLLGYMSYTHLFLTIQESILIFSLDIIGENKASKDKSKVKFRI